MLSALTTIIIIVGCMMVFLFTESGWGKDTPVAEADYSLTPAPVLPPAEKDFLQAALGDTVHAQTAPQVFSLQREVGRADAALRLSLRNGGVCEFLLIVEAPALPEAVGAKPTPAESRLYAYRRERYEADTQWICERFARFAGALDTRARLTDADTDSLLQFIRTAIETGKRQDKRIGGYLLRAYVDQSVTPAMLHASLQDETQTPDAQG